MCRFFIDKTRSVEDKVILIDASGLGDKVRLDEGLRTILSEIDEKLIVETFKSMIEKDDFSVCVTNKQIKDKGYPLIAGQFFGIKIKRAEITPQDYSMKIEDFEKELLRLFAKDREFEKEIEGLLGELKYE